MVKGVQDLLCSLTGQQKARWFRDAFSIPRLSWKHILKIWLSHLSQPYVRNKSPGCEVDEDSGESIDGVDAEPGQESVIPDPSSELIQSSELWFTVWDWLPEWVICKEPQCVFRASRDGYKYVSTWLSSTKMFYHIAAFALCIASVKTNHVSSCWLKVTVVG